MPGGEGALRTGSSADRIESVLLSGDHPPQRPDLPGREIGVFVSGHTHAPDLSKILRGAGEGAVVVNSGCWLRQLRPVSAHLGQPPAYVPGFVLTHARVFLECADVRAELWERPKPAPWRLRTTERLAVLGRLPAQPTADQKPRITAGAELP